MTITLTPDIEAAVREQANQQGSNPETVALDSLREKFVVKSGHWPLALIEPRDDWERRLASIGVHTGVSLTDEQLSREIMYEDNDS